MGIWKAKRERSSVRGSAGTITRRNLLAADRKTDPRTSLAWQQEVEMYDEWGPGFVGSWLDLIADKVSDCGARLVPRAATILPPNEQTTAAFNGVWSTWRGPYMSTKETLSRHCRLWTKRGECYVLTLDSGRKVIAHHDELLWREQENVVIWRDPVCERKEFIPLDSDGLLSPRVWRSWKQNDRDPREATSDLKRALPHIREYINVKLRQDSDTVSPLVRNKILLFGEGTETFLNPDNPNDPRNDMPQAFVDYLALASKREAMPYHMQRRPQDTIPFPMVGDKIETVDIGRNVDPNSSAQEAGAIAAFARAVHTPSQYIQTGPGVAKYNNEAFVVESFVDDAVKPIACAILADIWRIWAMPTLAFTLAKMRDTSFAAELAYLDRYELQPDLDVIRPKVRRAQDLIEGFKIGAVSLAEVNRVLGVDHMVLPDDVTEYDIWRLVLGTGSLRNARALEIVRTEGLQALRNEDVAGLPIGPQPGTELVPRPPNPMGPKPDPYPTVVTRNAPSDSAVNVAEGVRAAAAITARAGDARFSDLVAAAATTDSRLFSELTGLQSGAYQQAIDETARLLARSAPSGSELKRALALHASSAAKIAAAIQMHANIPDLPHDFYDRFSTQAKVLIAGALAAFVARGRSAGAFKGGVDEPVFYPGEAAQRLARGLREHVQWRVHGGGGGPDSDLSIPNTHVRDALRTAGGEIGTRDIESPGAGAAMSRATVAAMRAAGAPTDPSWRWAHGYYRTPVEPDAVHVAMDGARVASVDAQPDPAHALAGVYPGDHDNCTCAWVLTYEPVASLQ